MKKLLTSLFLVFGIASSATAGTFELEFKEDITILKFSGEIVAGDDLKLYDDITTFEVDVVQLNSIGGSADTGWKMAQVIRSQGVDTYVGANDGCHSACTYAFIGGVDRTADDTALFGFHPASLSKPLGFTDINAYVWAGQYTAAIAIANYIFYSEPENAYNIAEFIQEVYTTTYYTNLYFADKSKLQTIGYINGN